MKEKIIKQKRHAQLTIMPHKYPPLPNVLPDITIYQSDDNIIIEYNSLSELIETLQQIEKDGK